MVTPAEVGFVGAPQLASHGMNGLLVLGTNGTRGKSAERRKSSL